MDRSGIGRIESTKGEHGARLSNPLAEAGMPVTDHSERGGLLVVIVVDHVGALAQER